jgi:rRNA maturation endonuclease Nob1
MATVIETETTKEKRCTACGQVYLQIKTPQKSFDRDVEEDNCPYCGTSNGSSMSWSFNNKEYNK